MKYQVAFWLGILPFLLSPGWAGAVGNQEEIAFDLDYASFRYSESQVYLEVYYAIGQDQLQVVPADSQNVVNFSVTAQVFRKDSLVASRNWQGTSPVTASPEDRNEMLHTLVNFVLPEGSYRYVTTISDGNDSRTAKREFDLALPEFSPENLTMSDIELASSVKRDSAASIFTKNHYRVIPNPGALFGLLRPMLYFYAEIYNLETQTDSAYSVEYAVLNSDGAVVRSFPAKVRKKSGASVVEVGGINVVAFPTGSYALQLKVSDAGSKSTIYQKKKFYIYGTAASAVAKVSKETNEKWNAIWPMFKDATEEKLNEEFQSAAYLTTGDERDVFKTLDAAGKREFMTKFWIKRDIEPRTLRNELRDVHLARLKYANEHFGGMKKGWKTDRGRVLIKYGEPDEIERNPSLGDSRGYELWHYFNQQGGILFVFVDRTGFGNLELVHSTAQGEVFDPDWERWIRVQ